MLRNIVCLALALAFVRAAEEDASVNALATIELMKSQGLDESACTALANDAIKSINSSQSTNSKLLIDLKLGSDCAAASQTDVTAARKSLDDATTAATAAAEALTKANAVVPNIVVPSIAALVSIGSTCDFYKSDAVTGPMGVMNGAKSAKDKADEKVVSLTTALKDATIAAENALKTCRCAAKKELETTWTTVTDPTKIATDKSGWDQAQNLLCALNKKSPCDAPVLPTLSKPALSAEVAAQVCDGQTSPVQFQQESLVRL